MSHIVHEKDNNKKDLTFVMLYSLISLIVGLLFTFKQFGLSPDSIGYIDIAESIAQGNGFVVLSGVGGGAAWTYPSNTDVALPATLIMPLYPFLISLLIKIGVNSTFSARLVPVIFLALTPFPMYYLAKNLYGKTVAHASTIYLIVLLPLIMYGSRALTDTAFVFFILMSILFLSKLIISPDKDDFAKSKLIAFISGLFMGLAYLTKGNGIILIPVALFVIFFLISPIRERAGIKHKIGLFLLLFIGFSLVSSLWWIRNYFIFDNPLYYGGSSVFHIPTLQSFFNSLYNSLIIYKNDLFPLILCLPYCLKYLFDSEERKKFLLLVSFPIIATVFFTCWIFYSTRYALPTFPFLIIIGMKALFDMTEWAKNRFEIINKFPNKALIIVLLILFILPQCVHDVNYYSCGTNEKYVLEKMGTYESIAWIKTNTNQNDVILSDFPTGIYHYTKRNVVWTGRSPLTELLNYSSFMDAVNRLNISYVILIKEHLKQHSYSKEHIGDFVYNLSKGHEVPSNLEMVYNKDDAILYRCERQ